MSGGSFDYAYQRLHELRRWVDTFEDMAARCREWAASDEGAHKYLKNAAGTYDKVPTTPEDRARILVRALLLEVTASQLRSALVDANALESIMHDVEWVASGDYGVEALMRPIEWPMISRARDLASDPHAARGEPPATPAGSGRE